MFSKENERANRERLLQVLGKNNAIVLTGHIHKYSLLVRDVPGAGRFLQLAVSSVIRRPDPQAADVLSGVKDYNENQVVVEPGYSPATLDERKAVYRAEAPFVKQFQYADLPGYTVIRVNGPRITAALYPGISRTAWRTLDLSELLSA
jgi:hypothetical protein